MMEEMDVDNNKVLKFKVRAQAKFFRCYQYFTYGILEGSNRYGRFSLC
jgi:hypothetical protein